MSDYEKNLIKLLEVLLFVNSITVEINDRYIIIEYLYNDNIKEYINEILSKLNHKIVTYGIYSYIIISKKQNDSIDENVIDTRYTNNVSKLLNIVKDKYTVDKEFKELLDEIELSDIKNNIYKEELKKLLNHNNKTAFIYRVETAIRKLFSDNKDEFSAVFNKLLEITAKECGVNKYEIFSKKRSEEYVNARAIVSTILMRVFNMSVTKVSRFLDVHWSNIIYWNRKIDREYYVGRCYKRVKNMLK